jgi:hypothetical protein
LNIIVLEIPRAYRKVPQNIDQFVDFSIFFYRPAKPVTTLLTGKMSYPHRSFPCHEEHTIHEVREEGVEEEHPNLMD